MMRCLWVAGSEKTNDEFRFYWSVRYVCLVPEAEPRGSSHEYRGNARPLSSHEKGLADLRAVFVEAGSVRTVGHQRNDSGQVTGAYAPEM